MTTKYMHNEWLAELRRRFGPDPMRWAFVCPHCGDVATGADFKAALADHPRTKAGNPITASDILGQECIGRTLGALQRDQQEWDELRGKGEARGCDWTAYGLFAGPVTVVVPGAEPLRQMSAFEMAPGGSD